jgi:hypothetical protein
MKIPTSQFFPPSPLLRISSSSSRVDKYGSESNKNYEEALDKFILDEERKDVINNLEREKVLSFIRSNKIVSSYFSPLFDSSFYQNFSVSHPVNTIENFEKYSYLFNVNSSLHSVSPQISTDILSNNIAHLLQKPPIWAPPYSFLFEDIPPDNMEKINISYEKITKTYNSSKISPSDLNMDPYYSSMSKIKQISEKKETDGDIIQYFSPILPHHNYSKNSSNDINYKKSYDEWFDNSSFSSVIQEYLSFLELKSDELTDEFNCSLSPFYSSSFSTLKKSQDVAYEKHSFPERNNFKKELLSSEGQSSYHSILSSTLRNSHYDTPEINKDNNKINNFYDNNNSSTKKSSGFDLLLRGKDEEIYKKMKEDMNNNVVCAENNNKNITFGNSSFFYGDSILLSTVDYFNKKYNVTFPLNISLSRINSNDSNIRKHNLINTNFFTKKDFSSSTYLINEKKTKEFPFFNSSLSFPFDNSDLYVNKKVIEEKEKVKNNKRENKITELNETKNSIHQNLDKFLNLRNTLKNIPLFPITPVRPSVVGDAVLDECEFHNSFLRNLDSLPL